MSPWVWKDAENELVVVGCLRRVRLSPLPARNALVSDLLQTLVCVAHPARYFPLERDEYSPRPDNKSFFLFFRHFYYSPMVLVYFYIHGGSA